MHNSTTKNYSNIFFRYIGKIQNHHFHCNKQMRAASSCYAKDSFVSPSAHMVLHGILHELGSTQHDLRVEQVTLFVINCM